MTIKYKFIAFDGREFDSEDECRGYEESRYLEMFLANGDIKNDPDIQYCASASDRAQPFHTEPGCSYYWVRALNEKGAYKLSMLTGEEVHPSKEFFCIVHGPDDSAPLKTLTVMDAMASFENYFKALGYEIGFRPLFR